MEVTLRLQFSHPNLRSSNSIIKDHRIYNVLNLPGNHDEKFKNEGLRRCTISHFPNFVTNCQRHVPLKTELLPTSKGKRAAEE
jgi:hypothetical protein